MKNVLKLIEEKVNGAYYEYEDKYHIFNWEDLTLLGYKKFNWQKEGAKTRNQILQYLLEDFHEPIDKNDFIKETNIAPREENLVRLKNIYDLIMNEMFGRFVEDPLRSGQDNLTEYIDMNNDLSKEDIEMELLDKGISVKFPLDKVLEIISDWKDEDKKVNVIQALANYFEEKSLSQALYTYTPDWNDESQYFVMNIINGLEDFPTLQFNPAEHPDQLRFPGMKKEAYRRLLDLAGVLNETKTIS